MEEWNIEKKNKKSESRQVTSAKMQKRVIKFIDWVESNVYNNMFVFTDYNLKKFERFSKMYALNTQFTQMDPWFNWEK